MKTQEKSSGTTPPPPRKYRRPTTTARVKGELGDVVVKLKTGELEPKRANALIYALSTLAGVINASDVEKRLQTLEATIKAPPPFRPTGPLFAPPVPLLRVPTPETEQ